jgi:hypothetical protein
VSKIIEQFLGHLFTNTLASVGREDLTHADECAVTAIADRADSAYDSSGCFVDCENQVTASFEHAKVLVRTWLSRPTFKEAGKHRCIDVIKRLCISDRHLRFSSVKGNPVSYNEGLVPTRLSLPIDWSAFKSLRGPETSMLSWWMARNRLLWPRSTP